MLQVLASGRRDGTLLDNRYVRLRGDLDDGRIGHIQRQTKYKLQAMMELGLIPDDREFGPNETYPLQLTAKGKQLYDALKQVIKTVDLSLSGGANNGDDELENEYETLTNGDEILTWRMAVRPEEFNRAIWRTLQTDTAARNTARQIFLDMPAVAQMLNYLYRVERKSTVTKADIYRRFFASPDVAEYCDQRGIEGATEEGARHRCPFLLNVLEAIGLLEQNRNRKTKSSVFTVTLKTFLAAPVTLRMNYREPDNVVVERVQRLIAVWPDHSEELSSDELSILREAFGSTFLTQAYFLSTIETMS
jgi:hypothetical protein